MLLIIATILAITIVAIFLFLPYQPIVLLTTSDGKFGCQLPSSFILKWRHSVERQYWQEVYVLDGSHLMLTQTYIQSFGAGVPTSGKPIAAPNGYVGQSVNILMPKIDWMVSRVMQGEILANDKRFAINHFVENYTSVHIEPVKYNVWRRHQISACPFND